MSLKCTGWTLNVYTKQCRLYEWDWGEPSPQQMDTVNSNVYKLLPIDEYVLWCDVWVITVGILTNPFKCLGLYRDCTWRDTCHVSGLRSLNCVELFAWGDNYSHVTNIANWIAWSRGWRVEMFAVQVLTMTGRETWFRTCLTKVWTQINWGSNHFSANIDVNAMMILRIQMLPRPSWLSGLRRWSIIARRWVPHMLEVPSSIPGVGAFIVERFNLCSLGRQHLYSNILTRWKTITIVTWWFCLIQKCVELFASSILNLSTQISVKSENDEKWTCDWEVSLLVYWQIEQCYSVPFSVIWNDNCFTEQCLRIA